MRVPLSRAMAGGNFGCETTVGDAHTTVPGDLADAGTGKWAGELLHGLGHQRADALGHCQVAAEVPRRPAGGKGQHTGPGDLDPRHDGGHHLGHSAEGSGIDKRFVSDQANVRAASLCLASALTDAHPGSGGRNRPSDHPIGVHDRDSLVDRTTRGDHRPLRAVNHRQAWQTGACRRRPSSHELIPSGATWSG
jgi:hypothetical protein